MRTPVSTVRQCLTDEAARALDDAVAVARRRSHVQTTSLHAVSALLALPSSTLREACTRARSSAYPPRLQFRALELSVGVSLDRLPSSKAQEEPPISNSLMAAIKRSQANQRRHPETFHLYQQMQQNNNQTSLSCVKVELKHFILSILDDPIVSRVFGEAGFRSCDIKLAIVHPPPVSRFSRSRCPPLFLCNLTDSESSNRRSFNFPFAGVSGFENEDGNCRRIGEVFVKKKGKNPLLIGVCANDALSSFTEIVQRGKSGVLPAEIDGLSVICIEKEISEFFAKVVGSEEMMGLKFKELGDLVDRCSGPGIVVSFGELKAFVDGESIDAASYVVSQLSSLLEVHNGKLWLMGAAGSYETYMKFLAGFPSTEKDWDLHLLPITSSQPSVGGLYSKPSLMGSFVPLGGFFSTPSEFKNVLGSTNQSVTRCDLCNEKYEQEATVVLKGGSTISVSDQYSASLPSWLQMAECDTSKRVDAVKAKDDRTVLNAELLGLQRKWNDICQRLHRTQPFQPDISLARSQVPGVRDSQFAVDGKESSSKESYLHESGCASRSSFMPMDLQKISPPKQNIPISVASEAENASFQPKLPVEFSKSQQLEMGNSWPLSYPMRSLSIPPDHTSSSSVTSVTTDLGLGTLYASTVEEPSKKFQEHKDRLQYFSGSVSADLDGVSENASNQITRSSCSGAELGGQLDPRDFKSLWRALAEKVGWQDEAICTISQTISRCRTGHGRRHGSNHKGDIWLSFLGPDKVGKKKIAAALAELIFSSRENLISVDLSSEDGISHTNSIFDHRYVNSYEVKFRGKTIVDHIAEELSKKPHSVVLLENVDKANFPAQKSLYQAITTGKFPDSHGREISINNMIFVTTSRITKVDKNIQSGREHIKFSEERILEAKGWQMQILIGCVAGNATRTNGTNVVVMPRKAASNPLSANKRRLIDTSDSSGQDTTSEIPKRAHKASKSCLDLNLPAEEMEEENDYGNCDSDSTSESSEAWLEDFFDQVDEKVTFRPFDFDALAKEVLKEISLSFQNTLGSEALLEIDPEVMLQILAAAWLSERRRAVEDWVEQVLRRSFAEAQQRYCLTAHSVVRLVACEGHIVEERAPGVCLPARVILN
uniref:Clp R domain-containing protein n=1 Tax=Davidia involucrata TaxID=16924 RepID=A0A5B6ZHI0_DAVIN